MALWAYHNLLDLATVLPLSPVSLFARKHQGSERNRVLLYSNHICCLDQIAYLFTTFERSSERTEGPRRSGGNQADTPALIRSPGTSGAAAPRVSGHRSALLDDA
jgi:hypothetical protein